MRAPHGQAPQITEGETMRLSTLIYNIPVIGWMLRSAARGSDSEKIFFLLDLVMVWVIAIVFFGLPAVIYPAVVLAVAMLLFLVYFTASDMWEQSR
jgi:hypothetical protein